MSSRDFLDCGDRVVIVGNAFVHGSSDLSRYQGKHGIITSNNGFGLCDVVLDDGPLVMAWNGADLKKEG